jgi:hypothetical protein
MISRREFLISVPLAAALPGLARAATGRQTMLRRMTSLQFLLVSWILLFMGLGNVLRAAEKASLAPLLPNPVTTAQVDRLGR